MIYLHSFICFITFSWHSEKKFATNSKSVFEEVAINRNKSKNNIRSHHKHLPLSVMTKKYPLKSYTVSLTGRQQIVWREKKGNDSIWWTWISFLLCGKSHWKTNSRAWQRKKKNARELEKIRLRNWRPFLAGVEINQLTNGCSSEIAPFYLNQWCLFHINRERNKNKERRKKLYLIIGSVESGRQEGKKSQSRKSFSKLITIERIIWENVFSSISITVN